MMMDKVEKAVIDLDGEWPEGTGSFLVLVGDHYYTSTIRPFGIVCEYPEFMEARKRLENKPSWDSAPEWAQWLGIFCDEWHWYPVRPEPGIGGHVVSVGESIGLDLSSGNKAHVFGDWRQSLEPRPQTDNKEGEGVKWEPGVDLPPIGIECEVRHAIVGWVVVGILAHVGEFAIYWHQDRPRHETADRFRPIQTHRDKVIEAAMEYANPLRTLPKILGEMYDAGMLKLPGEEE